MPKATSVTIGRRSIALTLLAFLATLVACDFRNRPPRTRADILRDQERIDTLYITADGKQLIAPGAEQGMVVDPDTRQVAFRAWECNNPNCPGRLAEGGPSVFPLPDPFAYVDDQGQVRVRQPKTPAELKQVAEYFERKCPHCLKIRKLSQETDEVRQQYQGWLVYHVLPKSKERLAELEKEYREYVAAEQKRSGN